MSRLYRASALLALASAGCGNGGGDVTPPDDNYSLTISTSTSAVTMMMGGSATLTVTVVRGGGYAGAISLEIQGLPTYMSGTLSPPTLTGSATTSTLTLTAGSELGTGSYSIVIKASGPDVDWAFTEPITCTVTEPPGFSLSLPSATMTVIQGQSGLGTVVVTRKGGWTGAVTLALDGAPAGVTGAFEPNPATSDQSVLTLSVAAEAVTGTFALLVKGSGPGVAEQSVALTLTVDATNTVGFALTVAPDVVTVNQGSSASATVTVHRTGGFAGEVRFFAEGMPAGIAPSFAPPSTSGNTTTLSIGAGPTMQPGTHPLTVRGEATGQPPRRVSLQVKVIEVPNFSISPSPSAVTVSPGTPAQVVQVTIMRSGGFAGEVALSMSGLPAFVTAAVNPATTTGTLATVTLSAESGATAGTYTGIVHATASGFPERTASVTVTVALAGTSIVWRFCGASPQPVFLAYQDGSSPYTAVSPAGDGTFTTVHASTRGAVVIVQAIAGFTTQLRFASTAELQAMAAAQCSGPFATKTVHGSVANVPPAQYYMVALGGGMALGMPGASADYTIDKVMDGVHDLMAGRADPVGEGAEPNRFIIRRDQNPAAGSTIAVLDFAGAEGFDPASASLTITGLDAGASNEISLGFQTANGTVGLTGALPMASATTRTWFGIPAASLRTGDLHSIVAVSEGGFPQRDREVTLYSHEVGPRTITFAAELPPPAVTVHATTPVYRLRAAGSFGSTGSAFGGIAEVTFAQSDRTWIVSQTRAWTGTTSNYDLRTVILTNLPGWNESLYGVKSSSLVTWSMMCVGSAVVVPADGVTLQRLTFRGELTP